MSLRVHVSGTGWESKGEQATALHHRSILWVWCRALQRFSADSGISAIRSKLHFNEERIKLLTIYSRGLGQQWRKQIETSPSLSFSVLWGCESQSYGLEVWGTRPGSSWSWHCPNTGPGALKHQGELLPGPKHWSVSISRGTRAQVAF